MRTPLLQRLFALVLGVVLFANSGVYSAAVAIAEKATGAHKVDVTWSHHHATVSLRHTAETPLHHHGLPERMLLLNASDGDHPDHVLSSDAPQLKSVPQDPQVDRTDVLIAEWVMPSSDPQAASLAQTLRNLALDAADARCPRQTEVLRTVCLLV